MNDWWNEGGEARGFRREAESVTSAPESTTGTPEMVAVKSLEVLTDNQEEGSERRVSKGVVPMVGVATAALALGIFGGTALSGGEDETVTGTTAEPSGHLPPAGEGPSGKVPPAPSVSREAAVTLTAERSPFRPSAGRGGIGTAIKIIFTNNTDKKIGISPYLFRVTDIEGGVWTAEMPAPVDGVEPQNVNPGQSVGGTIAVQRDLDPVRVSFVGDLFGNGNLVTATVK